MMKTIGPYIPGFIAGIVSVVGAWFAYRSSRSASHTTLRVKALEVDAAAYERARTMYESGIKQLEEQIARLRQQVSEERDASNRLRNQVNELEETVARLRRQLIVSGIDVSAPPSTGRSTSTS